MEAPLVEESADPRALLGLTGLASMFQPFAPGALEPLVRMQLSLRDLVHQGEKLAALADTGRPVPNLTVLTTEPVAHTESSGFGWRDDPIRHTRRFHSGTDFRGKPGTPVVAAGAGVVTFCGRMGGYGNMVEIDHGGGVITRYAHLRRIETKKNATVTAGLQIGQVGSTGRATGPHLHFEVRLDGAPVSATTALSVASLQREVPLVGHIAAMTLAPEFQARAESEIDPPKGRRATQRHAAKDDQRPERSARGKRKQVLW